MDVSIDESQAGFVESVVKSGRYGSASEVVSLGLRLVEAQEAKLQALRKMVDDAIEEGGEYTDEDVDAALDAVTEELKQAGY